MRSRNGLSQKRTGRGIRLMFLYLHRGKAAFEHAGMKAALVQDVRAGRATPAAVAVDHVMSIAIERFELEPNEVERHVDRAFDMEGLVLARQAHVQPLPALGNDRLRLLEIDPLEHGRVEQCRSEEHTSELQSRENIVCR